MRTILLAASAAIVTLALSQIASAAPTANGVALKSAIETTATQVGYYGGYGYRYYRPRYYRPYYDYGY